MLESTRTASAVDQKLAHKLNHAHQKCITLPPKATNANSHSKYLHRARLSHLAASQSAFANQHSMKKSISGPNSSSSCLHILIAHKVKEHAHSSEVVLTFKSKCWILSRRCSWDLLSNNPAVHRTRQAYFGAEWLKRVIISTMIMLMDKSRHAVVMKEGE